MNMLWTAILYHSKVQTRPTSEVALTGVNYHILGNIDAVSAANGERMVEAELEKRFRGFSYNVLPFKILWDEAG